LFDSLGEVQYHFVQTGQTVNFTFYITIQDAWRGNSTEKWRNNWKSCTMTMHHVTLLQCSGIWQGIKFKQSCSHQFYKSHSVQLLNLPKTQHWAKKSPFFIFRRNSTMREQFSQQYQKKYARGVPISSRTARRKCAEGQYVDGD